MNIRPQFQKRPEMLIINSARQRPVEMNAHRCKATTGHNQTGKLLTNKM